MTSSFLDQIRTDGDGYEIIENPPVPDRIWADANTDQWQRPDEEMNVLEFVGGVGIPGIDALVRTEEEIYLPTDGNAPVATKAISLVPAADYDCVPMNRAYETASAFALAAACVDKNKPTPDAHTVDALAGRIRVLADMALNGTLPTVNGDVKEVL